MYRPILVLILACHLGGCGILASTPVAKHSLEQSADPALPRSATTKAFAPSDQGALAKLPAAAGTIKSLSRQSFADGLQQVISYDHSVAGFKPNEVLIVSVSSLSMLRLDPQTGPLAPRDQPTEAGIKTVLAADFPRMQMRIVNTPRSNEYGIYGLATGQWDNGVRCIYAWQWIDPLKTARDSMLVSLRIRICRSNMTLDQLAGIVDGIKIDLERGFIDVPVSQPVALPSKIANRAAEAERASPKAAAALRAPRKPAAAPQFVALVPLNQQGNAPTEPDPNLPVAAYRGPSDIGRIGQ
jgi:hypothetical protein